jgi:hypothetical protein
MRLYNCLKKLLRDKSVSHIKPLLLFREDDDGDTLFRYLMSSDLRDFFQDANTISLLTSEI